MKEPTSQDKQDEMFHIMGNYIPVSKSISDYLGAYAAIGTLLGICILINIIISLISFSKIK